MATVYVNVGGRSGETLSRLLWQISDPDSEVNDKTTKYYCDWVTGNDGNTYLIVPEVYPALVHPLADYRRFAGVLNENLRKQIRTKIENNVGQVVNFNRIFPDSIWDSRMTYDEMVAAGILDPEPELLTFEETDIIEPNLEV